MAECLTDSEVHTQLGDPAVERIPGAVGSNAVSDRLPAAWRVLAIRPNH